MKHKELVTAVPVTLQKFGASIGRSAPTLWRYRKKGWLRTVNIAGRPYVLPAEALEFERRAAAGEFAQDPHGAASSRGGGK
jgi:hypothetical protein